MPASKHYCGCPVEFRAALLPSFPSETDGAGLARPLLVAQGATPVGGTSRVDRRSVTLAIIRLRRRPQVSRQTSYLPMLPAWATVAISLGAALITAGAALYGSLVRGRQDRAQQLHDRRTDVAGDFSASSLRATSAIKDTVRSSDPDPTTWGNKQLEVLALVHDAETQVGLVSLLFGTRSDAARQAKVVRDRLRDAEIVVGHESFDEVWRQAQYVKDRAKEAETVLDEFMEAARKVLEGRADRHRRVRKE